MQQEIIDSGRGPTIPPLQAVTQGQSLPPSQIALACAEQAGLDVVNFASCTGNQVILRPGDQALVACATSSGDTQSFAACAAPLLGVKISDQQRELASCASNTDGDHFVSCAGSAVLNEDGVAALDCVSSSSGDASDFADCAAEYIVGRNATPAQQLAIACAAAAENGTDLADCAASQIELSDDQRAVVNCALRSDGQSSDFVGCVGSAALDKYLSSDAKTALQCAEDSNGEAEDFAACAASGILGNHATKEEKIALACAAQSEGDVEQMGVCAGANLFNMDMTLNPEQQIAVQCLVSTGGQPYAAAGCIATRLTGRELVKCFTDGVGGHGCFGDTNDLFGKNGWTARTLGEIGGGSNSVFHNPSQIWGGNNSFVRNPGQVFGGDNSFVRNPDQIFGGNNSIFHNPSQLAPAPVQIGKLGNTRICLPWC